MNRNLGADIMTEPYALNLGPFKATVVVDSSRQTRLHLVKLRLVMAFWYIDLRFSLSILPMIMAKTKQGVENNFLLYNAVGKILSTEKVVDSSKSYLKAAELYRRHPDRIKIILLIRDGRAVFYSGIKSGFRRRRCVNAWKNTYTRALPILKRHVKPADMLRIHYEELARNPETELRRVCEFAGLNFEPDMLAFMERDHHLTNGNNMRFGTDSSIRFDDSWREGLSPLDLSYFERRANALNKYLGYD